MSLSRRGFLFGSAGASLVLAGCGTGGAAPAEQAAPGFPMTVPGQLGDTTVTARPRRVVAAGYLRDTDLALALGAELVLSVRNQSFAKGLAAWAEPGSGVETAYVADGGLPIEKIAAAKPDLILASDDYDLKTDLPKLGRIAPTLGFRNGAGKDGWPQMTERAGDVLGKPARAAELVKQVQDTRSTASARRIRGSPGRRSPSARSRPTASTPSTAPPTPPPRSSPSSASRCPRRSPRCPRPAPRAARRSRPNNSACSTQMCSSSATTARPRAPRSRRTRCSKPFPPSSAARMCRLNRMSPSRWPSHLC
ncbi:substrate-binding family protein [Amycolatopsis sulphurea]|uniref:Substrate-binding family protein n=1 Tax=Amycolatopsis sulphurea TaxID=76022 RepID=A0A2A9G1W3_9PSEU|nr:substrate-binding family protein [Amycolatopsis sulphurea]